MGGSVACVGCPPSGQEVVTVSLSGVLGNGAVVIRGASFALIRDKARAEGCTPPHSPPAPPHTPCPPAQGQANKWVKCMEGKQGLKVLNLQMADLVRQMENALQTGAPVLLQVGGGCLLPHATAACMYVGQACWLLSSRRARRCCCRWVAAAS